MSIFTIFRRTPSTKHLDALLAIGFWLLVCDFWANLLIGPGIDVVLVRYLWSLAKGGR